MNDDPNQILGVKSTVMADEIKKAYCKIARSNHPDLNPDNPMDEVRRIVV